MILSCGIVTAMCCHCLVILDALRLIPKCFLYLFITVQTLNYVHLQYGYFTLHSEVYTIIQAKTLPVFCLLQASKLPKYLALFISKLHQYFGRYNSIQTLQIFGLSCTIFYNEVISSQTLQILSLLQQSFFLSNLNLCQCFTSLIKLILNSNINSEIFTFILITLISISQDFSLKL